MEKETKAIHTPFQKRDAYGALSFPVYNTVAYEFDSAQVMTEAFAGRVPEPDYSRVMNPTVTYFENRVKALSDADNVFALTTGMAAIFHTLLVFAEAGKTIVMSNHLFGNTFSLITTTLARLGEKAQIADFSDLARLLLQVPQVKRVNYPGLQLQKPFGAMLTIDLEPSRSATTSSTACA